MPDLTNNQQKQKNNNKKITEKNGWQTHKHFLYLVYIMPQACLSMLDISDAEWCSVVEGFCS